MNFKIANFYENIILVVAFCQIIKTYYDFFFMLANSIFTTKRKYTKMSKSQKNRNLTKSVFRVFSKVVSSRNESS